MTGDIVGRYEILEKLGEGGMGVVYRARDTQLGRFAALKFLPPQAGVDDDRKRRFVQEAQVASALNHPHIVTIYEIGVAAQQDFIAMEYVKGKPLASMIGPTGLPWREVLAYSIQVADALAAAHAAGIVHRDIKPANVIVTDAGVVKVLDFGLAKLVERAAAATADVTRTVAISSRTMEGSIVGTVAYMSPEQAEGKPVDHRSDIFSFGAMLYEMLTGKQAFTGDSAVSTLAAILRAEPEEISRHAPDAPRELDRIARRCLEKSADRRWQSMADVRVLLEDLKQDFQSGVFTRPAGLGAAPASAPAIRRVPLWALAATAAVLAASTGFLLWKSRDQQPAAARSYSFRRLTSDIGSNVSPAISPDGKLIAYSSDRSQTGATDIWVQQIAGGEAVRLTSNLGLCHSPSFSPDGSRIVFHGGPDAKGIYVVSTFGGEPRRVADGRSPNFSPDGNEIAYIGSANDRIMIVPALGGTPRELVLKHRIPNRPHWLPDGKRLLYLGYDLDRASREYDWYTIPAAGGEEQSAGAKDWLRKPYAFAVPAGVSADGVMIWAGQVDSSNIYRVPFDLQKGRVTGGPVPVTMAPAVNFWPGVSADGTKIVFGNAPNFNTNIWSISIDSATGAAAGEPRSLTDGLVDRVAPAPSADGKALAYKATSGTTQEIRFLDLATKRDTRIAETRNASVPVISEDGTQVAYGVREGDTISTYVAPVTGGVPRRLCANCGRPIEWLDRGTRILYDQAAKNKEIGLLDVGTGKTTTLVRTQSDRIFTPRLSPDRRWICITRINNAEERRLMLIPFSPEASLPGGAFSPETNWKPLLADGRQPVWSADGKLVYFLSERDGFRCVWAIRFDPTTSKAVGEPFGVHHLHHFRHSLLDFSDVADIGLSLSGKSIFLSVREIRSNIWLAERQATEPGK